MIDVDTQILKNIYRKWLIELGVEFSKKEKVSELEEKLLFKGVSLDEDRVGKLSRPLQEFIYTATKSNNNITEKVRNSVVKRSYYLTDKFGFQQGSKRSCVALLLANGNWWTRAQLLRQAKKDLGSCSRYTLDCVETYLRKKNYDLRISTNKEGITILKLYI